MSTLSEVKLSEVKSKMRKNKEERMNVIEYYNNSPTTDLIADIDQYVLCDDHKSVKCCEKCSLVHGNQHKCYVYDRLFMSFMGYSPHLLFTNTQLKHFEKNYYPDYKKGRYTLEWNDVSGSITSIWINDTEFTENCCFIVQKYYDWEE